MARRPNRFPAPREPNAVILGYARALRALFGALSAKLRDEFLGEVRWVAITEGIRRRKGVADELRQDAEVDELDDALERITIEIQRDQPDEVLGDIVERYGRDVNEHNIKEFRRTFKAALGLDLVGGAPHQTDALRDYTRDNVRLIKSVRSDQLERTRALIERHWRVGDRWEAIAKGLREEFRLDRNRANRIARDQVQKLNGELTRDRQLAAGIESFYWRTSKDGRVRAKHRGLEGRTFTWAKGHPTERIPGWPIHCRCYAEPVLLDPETGEPQGPLAAEPDQSGFPGAVGFARTSGGPRPRPSRGRPPPAPSPALPSSARRPPVRPVRPPAPVPPGGAPAPTRGQRGATAAARASAAAVLAEGVRLARDLSEALRELRRLGRAPDAGRVAELRARASALQTRVLEHQGHLRTTLEGLPRGAEVATDLRGQLERLRAMTRAIEAELGGR